MEEYYPASWSGLVGGVQSSLMRMFHPGLRLGAMNGSTFLGFFIIVGPGLGLNFLFSPALTASEMLLAPLSSSDTGLIAFAGDPAVGEVAAAGLGLAPPAVKSLNLLSFSSLSSSSY